MQTIFKQGFSTLIRVAAIFLSAFFLSISVYAEDHASEHQHHNDHDSHQKVMINEDKQSSIESLSPELRDVLSKEMLALQEGMKSIIPAYISANWHEIETIAIKMKNSYIMQQKLTSEQMGELHSKLSPRFIEQDQEFHYLAGMLAHAAEKKKPELVGFYFSKLSESCVACHTRFATHKFPAFLKDKPLEAHHH